MTFNRYKRLGFAEARPVTDEEIQERASYLIKQGISISQEDQINGSPKRGDMIARNPKNHKDQWLIAKEYFEANFEKDINGKSN